MSGSASWQSHGYTVPDMLNVLDAFGSFRQDSGNPPSYLSGDDSLIMVVRRILEQIEKCFFPRNETEHNVLSSREGLPAHQSCRPGQAPPNAPNNTRSPCRKSLCPNRLIQRDRQGGRRCIPILFNHRVDRLLREAETTTQLLQNPRIGLMGNDPCHVAGRKPEPLRHRSLPAPGDVPPIETPRGLA